MRSVRALRTGPTTARPIGTRQNLDTTSRDRSSRPSTTCGRMVSRSAPCSSTRGSTHTPSCGHSTPRNGSCPPSALTAWEVRPDILPDGIAALRQRLRELPLIAHIRHLSAHAPIASETPTWVDGDYAAPSTPETYERWLDQCVSWGVETLEHDWLVEVFFGVRSMRSEPGRATKWQEGIDSAARDRGITVQWCMGTPADFAQTTTLTQVTSVRTSGDHGYIASAGQLWAWFCTTNSLARSLHLLPFKDVFRADPEVAGENGEPEALLSALSTGPVGLGDRVGRMDPALALRTCRADGLLIKPHTAIAATDESLLSGPAFTSTLLVAECTSEHPAGRWIYAVAMHANPGDEPISGEIRLESLSRPEVGAGAQPSRESRYSRFRGVGLAERDGNAAGTRRHDSGLARPGGLDFPRARAGTRFRSGGDWRRHQVRDRWRRSHRGSRDVDRCTSRRQGTRREGHRHGLGRGRTHLA